MAGVLYECDPRGFGEFVTHEEADALRVYYRLDQDADVEDIYAYRRQLERERLDIKAVAEQALRKVMLAYRVDQRELPELFEVGAARK